MSDVVICDACARRYDRDADDSTFWVRVGWRDGTQEDACSIDCAHALLGEMQQRQWEIEQMTEEELESA